MRRAEFMGQVHHAVAAGNRFGHPAIDLPCPRRAYIGAGNDPPARLVEEISAVGDEAYLVDDWPSAAARLDTLLDQAPQPRVLAWEHPLLERLELPQLVARHGGQLLSHAQLASLPPIEARALALQANLWVTSVEFAVAETGSLALAAAAGRERIASLLPPLHVAVVAADQILPDLYDWFDLHAPQGGLELASTVNFITGPSKTGDIELQLTTGVHGPGRFVVIVCRQTQ